MDFNEWKKENIYKGESKTWVEWCELAYEAGQQSKQAEIDALKAELAKREPMDLRDVDIPHGTIVLEK